MLGPIITGENLKLVPTRREHLADFCDWFADPEITRFLIIRFPPSPESEAQWFDKVSVKPNIIHWAVVRAEDGALIGNCNWDVSWQHRRASWGVCIGDKTAWNQGYGREILHLCLCYAFLELGLEKVTSNAFSDNAASVRLHESAGFERCALMRRQFYISGKWRDEWQGELFRADWEVKAGRNPLWKPRDY